MPDPNFAPVALDFALIASLAAGIGYWQYSYRFVPGQSYLRDYLVDSAIVVLSVVVAAANFVAVVVLA